MITVLSDSTGITSTDLSYIGMIYYEEKRVEDLVTFTSAKNLNALLKVCIYFHVSYLIIFYSILRKNTVVLRLVSVLSIVFNNLVIVLN